MGSNRIRATEFFHYLVSVWIIITVASPRIVLCGKAVRFKTLSLTISTCLVRFQSIHSNSFEGEMFQYFYRYCELRTWPGMFLLSVKHALHLNTINYAMNTRARLLDFFQFLRGNLLEKCVHLRGAFIKHYPESEKQVSGCKSKSTKRNIAAFEKLNLLFKVTCWGGGQKKGRFCHGPNFSWREC